MGWAPPGSTHQLDVLRGAAHRERLEPLVCLREEGSEAADDDLLSGLALGGGGEPLLQLLRQLLVLLLHRLLVLLHELLVLGDELLALDVGSLLLGVGHVLGLLELLRLELGLGELRLQRPHQRLALRRRPRQLRDLRVLLPVHGH